jgi:hypothetical protein
VAEVAGELACLRGTLAAALDGLGLRAAGAGTHPAAQWQETEIAAGERYQAIHETMRELARREPTFALHVHVGIPDPEQALQALVRLRAHLPALIALSANSPYWQGRDSGMAAVRLPVFGGFPRTGIPRSFADYADYVEAVDVLLRCGAFPEPTFLWWDLRLQPALGTLEVRVMDAQTRIDDVERADRPRAVPRAPRGDGGPRARASSSSGPRCSTRTASSPPATGWTPHWSTPAAAAGVPSSTSSGSSWRRARRTPRPWAVRRSCAGWRGSPAARAMRGSGRSRPAGRGGAAPASPPSPRPGRRLRA